MVWCGFHAPSQSAHTSDWDENTGDLSQSWGSDVHWFVLLFLQVFGQERCWGRGALRTVVSNRLHCGRLNVPTWPLEHARLFCSAPSCLKWAGDGKHCSRSLQCGKVFSPENTPDTRSFGVHSWATASSALTTLVFNPTLCTNEFGFEKRLTSKSAKLGYWMDPESHDRGSVHALGVISGAIFMS